MNQQTYQPMTNELMNQTTNEPMTNEPMNQTTLTPKQQLFCDEYLTDRNATRAALRAGYSASTALNGNLMALPKIRLYLQERTEQWSEQAKGNYELIGRELAKVAFGNMGAFFTYDGRLKPMGQICDDDKAALASLTVTKKTDMYGTETETVSIRMHSKMAALDRLAKHSGFYGHQAQEPEKEYVNQDLYSPDENDRFEDKAFDGYPDSRYNDQQDREQLEQITARIARREAAKAEAGRIEREERQSAAEAEQEAARPKQEEGRKAEEEEINRILAGARITQAEGAKEFLPEGTPAHVPLWDPPPFGRKCREKVQQYLTY